MAKNEQFNYTVTVDGNISGLNDAMKKATAVMQRTANTIKNVDLSIKDDPNNINLLKQRQQLQVRYIQETKKALQDLKAIQNSIKNDPDFKKGVTDLGLEYSKVTREIAKTEKALLNANKELEKTRLAVSNSKFDQKVRKWADELVKAQNAVKNVTNSLANIDKRIELDPYNVELYAEKQDLLADKLQAVSKELEVLEKQRNVLENPLFRKETEEQVRLLEENRVKTAELVEQKKQLEDVIANRLTPKMEVFARRMQDVSQSMYDIANRTSRLSSAFKTFLTTSFDSAKTYETGIASIEKVTGELSDNVIQDLKDIAVKTGTTFDKVSEYATLSGALGLAEDEIVSFTKTMLDLNAVSGGAFTGEEGAKGIAVFLNQLNLGTNEAENFASAIASLGDKYADVGDETVHVATRLSGLASIIDTNQYELLGLSAVMADLGLSADTNANGINRAFLQIESVLADSSKKGQQKLEALAKTSGMTAEQFRQEWGVNAVDAFLKFVDGLKSTTIHEIDYAVQNSTATLQQYADVLGVTADEFKILWGNDSQKVFDDYVEAMGNMSEENESASAILKALGVSSVNTSQTLLRLSGSGNDVREAIELANKAWTENTAIQDKTAIVYGTTQNKLESFYEALRQFQASLIDSVLPTIKDALDDFTALFKMFSKLDPTTRKLILSFVAIGSAISPTARAVGNFTSNMFKVDKATGQFIRTAGKLEMTLGGKVGIILAVVGAILALASAMRTAYENTEEYQRNAQLIEYYENTKQALDEMNQSMKETNFEYDIQNEKIKNQIREIDELNQKIQDSNLTEQESRDTKEQLKKKIDELNQAMGGSFYYWDETTGKIRNEKGEIVGDGGLIDAYAQLEIARKKSFMLENYQDEYLNSLKIEKEAIEKVAEIRQNLRKDVDKTGYLDMYGADFVNNAQQFALAMEKAKKEGTEISPELQKWAESLSTTEKLVSDELGKKFVEAQNRLDEQFELIDNASKIIKDYEAIQTTEGDGLGAMLDAFNKYGTSDINEAMRIANEQIAEANKELEYRELLDEKSVKYYEDQILRAQEFLELVGQLKDTQLTAEDEVQAKKMENKENFRKSQEQDYEEMYNPESGTIIVKFKDGQHAMQSTASESNKIMWDNFKKTAFGSVDEVVAYIQSQNPTMNVNVAFHGLGNVRELGISGHYAGSYITPFSGGFGANEVFNSLSHSLSNLNSGGFNSRGIYLTANFTINNATNLNNRAMAQQFARVMIDEINNGLGMEI